VIVLGVVATASGSLALGLTGTTEAADVFAVEVLDASVDDGRLTAAVRVQNQDATRQNVAVWLSLGAFGPAGAWERRLAEASTQNLGIKTDETVLIVWDEAVAVPTGSYELTVWVRTEIGDGLVIQRTAGFALPVESSGISRVAPPGDGPSLVMPVLELRGGKLLTLKGSVFARDANPDSEIKIDVLDADDPEPWWRRPAVANYLLGDGVAGDEWEFTVDTLTALPAGSYALRVELISPDSVDDTILLPSTVTIAPPEGLESGLTAAAGPLAIVGVDLDDSDGDFVVSVEVQNLSTEPVDGLFWWLLSSPGEPEPWDFVDGRSFEIGRRLEGRERRTIRLVADGAPNAGTGFELSVWVHTTDPDEESTHSDGVRLPELIDTITTESGT